MSTCVIRSLKYPSGLVIPVEVDNAVRRALGDCANKTEWNKQYLADLVEKVEQTLDITQILSLTRRDVWSKAFENVFDITADANDEIEEKIKPQLPTDHDPTPYLRSVEGDFTKMARTVSDEVEERYFKKYPDLWSRLKPRLLPYIEEAFGPLLPEKKE